jgi:hypothetical protein
VRATPHRDIAIVPSGGASATVRDRNRSRAPTRWRAPARLLGLERATARQHSGRGAAPCGHDRLRRTVGAPGQARASTALTTDRYPSTPNAVTPGRLLLRSRSSRLSDAAAGEQHRARRRRGTCCRDLEKAAESGRRAVASCGAPARLSGWARSQNSRPALTCIIGARRAWIVPMISSTSIPCR